MDINHIFSFVSAAEKLICGENYKYLQGFMTFSGRGIIVAR